jgi:hypothetical protein
MGRKNAKAPQQNVLHGLAARMLVWPHEGQREFSQRSQCLKRPDYAKSARALVCRGLPVPRCRTANQQGWHMPQCGRGPTGIEANADGWPDDVRLSDIEPLFTCTRCGKKGAEVRPKFSHARMGTG